MSAHELGFKQTQLLISQIIHDVISLFTSLSAGMDMAQDTQGEVWNLVKETKDQLYAQLSLFRFIFGTGEGTPQDANKIMAHFGKAFNITIKGSIEKWPKVTLALALWILKHIKNRQGAILRFDKNTVVLSSTHIFPLTDQDDILQNVRAFQSCQESYAGYISCLLALNGKKIFISRSTTEVCIGMDTGQIPSKSSQSQIQS